jgi:DHA2 family multidrug resistance protein
VAAEQGRASTARRDSTALFIAMMCMFAASFMQQLDGTIVNVSLPFMQGGLQSSREEITWILTSYILASAIMTAPAAAISARIGRKKLFQICVVGFTVTSVLCGLAQTLDQMVVLRFLQGAFSGGMMPVAWAAMIDNYSGADRVRMMSYFSVSAMLGPVAGPTVGGYITEVLDWRWNFFLNVPIGIAIFAGIAIFFHDTKDTREPRPFDTFGFVSLSAGIAAFQLMMDRGPSKDWFDTPEIVLELLVGVIAIYLFSVHMITAKNRFVPPAIFRDRNFNISTIISTVNVAMTYASTALLPPYLQTLGGRSVLDTGLLLSPRGIGAVVGAVAAARFLAFVDLRYVIAVGWAFNALSLWAIAHWTPDISTSSLVLVSLMQGAGLTVIGAASNASCFRSLPAYLVNEGTSVGMLIRNAGSAILISITSSLLVDTTMRMHSWLAEEVTPFNRNLSFGAPSMFWNLKFPFGLDKIDAIVSRNASIVAYSDVFLLLTLLSFVIPVALYFLPKSDADAAPELEMMHVVE